MHESSSILTYQQHQEYTLFTYIKQCTSNVLFFIILTLTCQMRFTFCTMRRTKYNYESTSNKIKSGVDPGITVIC